VFFDQINISRHILVAKTGSSFILIGQLIKVVMEENQPLTERKAAASIPAKG